MQLGIYGAKRPPAPSICGPAKGQFLSVESYASSATDRPLLMPVPGASCEQRSLSHLAAVRSAAH
jgi:hypothetical protein